MTMKKPKYGTQKCNQNFIPPKKDIVTLSNKVFVAHTGVFLLSNHPNTHYSSFILDFRKCFLLFGGFPPLGTLDSLPLQAASALVMV